ncbi:MAG: FRG domain-containing protein [Phycisphaerae bacterium]|jgi:hypothetical protein
MTQKTKTPKILTWGEYKDWISHLVKNDKRYYCRGHANDTWKLQTSFHREAIHNQITLPQYLELIIPEIHYHISAVRDEIIDLSNNLEFAAFLALIQHYGFPTPLLDWTLSPYIAAYFAFREVNDFQPQSENVKIYIFDYVEWSKSFKQPMDLKDMTSQYVSILRPYAKYNPRIIPQQGIFTVTNVYDMETHIHSCETNSNKKFLYAALLSVKEKPIVLKELNLMGINEMSLFPGVDGICRALKTLFFSTRTVGLTLRELLEIYQQNQPANNSISKKV